jgi:hypothetical protein
MRIFYRRNNMHRAQIGSQLACWMVPMAFRMRAARLTLFVMCLSEAEPCFAQKLPTTDDFGAKLANCATAQKVALPPNLIAAISSIYSAQRSYGAPGFMSAAGFLTLVPKALTLESYRLYRQCIVPIMSSTDPTVISDGLSTFTCVAERDLSWNRRTEEIIIPLNCPPESEEGYGFTISGSYACGDIVKQKIVFDDKQRPTAVNISISEKCLHSDNDVEAAQRACPRRDESSYKATHTCVIVSFHARK